MNPIVIKTHHVKECKSSLVRLQADAERIVQCYQRESGLSRSYIVSEILRQTEGVVEFVGVDDVQMH